MDAIRYLVLMRPEGRKVPTFAQETSHGACMAWEDVAVDAVDLALRGAPGHFEVACGFRFDPQRGAWVECGSGGCAVDIGSGSTNAKTWTAEMGENTISFISVCAGRREITVAVQHLSGQDAAVRQTGRRALAAP